MIGYSSMINRQILGYFELTLAQFCIGVNIILGKILIDTIPMTSLLLFRFIIGFILMTLFLGLTHNITKQDFPKLTKYTVFLIFIQGLCGGFLFNIFTLWGLHYTTANAAGIINTAVPALVTLFSIWILKEVFNLQKGLAITLSILGILVLSLGKTQTGQGLSSLLGIGLVTLAIIPEALFTIFAKLSKNPPSPWVTTALINFFNILLLLPLLLFEPIFLLTDLNLKQGLQILLYGVSGGIGFFAFWYRGLKYVNANTAALFMGIMPISTCLLAYIFLNEPMLITDYLGMFFVLISIVVGTYSFKRISSIIKNESTD